MLEYGYELKELKGDVFCIRFIDFPMLSVAGLGHHDIRGEAKAYLDALISTRIRERLRVPKPEPASNTMTLNHAVALRLQLYWRLQEVGMDIDRLAVSEKISSVAILSMLNGVIEDDMVGHVPSVARAMLPGDFTNVVQTKFTPNGRAPRLRGEALFA